MRETEVAREPTNTVAAGRLPCQAEAVAPMPPRGGRRPAVSANGQNRRVDLARVGWIMTVFACLVAVLILLLQGYYGYALVTFAVAVSAAFNLT
ncbi:MAG: hypothetical protein QOF83_2864 [Solirubrobacteraceae bacterium]|jgi:hypothetical protein|nr:hypothetical protein [Solirubrobacteraceae bacterium]